MFLICLSPTISRASPNGSVRIHSACNAGDTEGLGSISGSGRCPGGGNWPRDVLKKVSRGLSRVEAGNPGCPRLVQVTSGSSHGGSEKPGKLEVGGASRLHWAWCIGRGPHLQLRQEPQGTSDFRLRSQGPCRLGTGESGLVLG